MTKHIIIPSFLLAFALASCVSDSSTYGDINLPSLSVAGVNGDKLPEVNFNYGDDCVINPDIQYTGSGTLRYEWSVATFDDGVKGTLEKVSEERELRYFFPKGGSYVAHLRVTDGIVGMVQEYQVNINRSFEVGYILVANDRNGNGNLTFIKSLTPEEAEAGQAPVITEHSLERINPNIQPARLIAALDLKWSLSYTETVTRIVASTEKQCLFLDPNTFVVAAAIDYNELIPGFKAAQLLGDATVVRAYDPVSKRYITATAKNLFGYEESEYVGHGFDKVFSGCYYAYGTNNYEHYYVNRSPLSVGSYSYMGWTSTDDITEDKIAGKDLPAGCLPLFNDEELITAFMGESIPQQYYDLYPCYVLSRNKSTGRVYTTYLDGFGAYSFGVELVSKKESPVTDDSALPAPESPVVPTSKYHRSYFYNGNCVYTMLFEKDAFQFPLKSQYSISYPDDEEVTFITDNADTDELIVATCNKNTGRGSVYFYDMEQVRTNNPNPTPKAQYLNCTDRISQIKFKPRVAN